MEVDEELATRRLRGSSRAEPSNKRRQRWFEN